MGDQTKKVGLLGLVAMVIGSMIGGGVFNIPSNMAGRSTLGPVILAWLITGFGMFFLVSVFRILSTKKSDLSSGIYSYAAEGFGNYVGFNSVWGYWLSAAIGNVSFAVLVMQALGYFFPVFQGGNNWQSILGGSIIIWGMAALVMRGVNGAALLNIISTIAKLVPLVLIIILLLFAFHWDNLSFDFWGEQNANLGGLSKQLESTMLVTLWSFIGIEGAVVISGRAKNKKDVGTATFIGFIGALLIYASISIFSFGIMHQADLAKLPNPSAAYVLQAVVGKWGAVVVNVGVIVSILGAWIAWTIITAEVLYDAAEKGVVPRILRKTNKNDSPVAALIISGIIMQITLFSTLVAKNAYLAIISMAGSMILVPYILSAMYLWKLSTNKEEYGGDHRKGKIMALVSGIIASLYGIWLVYAAGLNYVLMSSILYAVGIVVYRKAVRDNDPDTKVFQTFEKVIAGLLVVAALISIFLMIGGHIDLHEWEHWISTHIWYRG